MRNAETKKAFAIEGFFHNKCPVITYSHIANATLPSALLLFTSVFGMGTGGTTALWSPGEPFYIKYNS